MPFSPSSSAPYVQNAMLVLAFAAFDIYYPLELAFVQHNNQWLRRIDIFRELLFLANTNSTNYQCKMETAFAIASKIQLSEPLRERIHQYYDHIWREYESLDGEIKRFSKNLSHTLELEVVLCKHMDLAMEIPFWVDSSPDFQKCLMLNLRVYLADDYVIHRGEANEEFYMINRGSVELATSPNSLERPIGGPDNNDGDGKVGLASKTNGNSRQCYRLDEEDRDREQHVRMCVLNRKDFQEILTRHPVDRKKVVSAMLSMCMLKNEAEAAFCPLKEIACSVHNSSNDSGSRQVGGVAQIGTVGAASQTLDVLNPDLED